jgi:hypothetical protein
MGGRQFVACHFPLERDAPSEARDSEHIVGVATGGL